MSNAARTACGLDEFIREMELLMATKMPEPERWDIAAGVFRRVCAQPDILPAPYRRLSTRRQYPNFAQYAVYRSPTLSLMGIVLGPRSISKPHDHRCWSMFGVFENMVEETRYHLTPATADRPPHVTPGRSFELHEGEVSIGVHEVDEIHKIVNPNDRLTVAMTVYPLDVTGAERWHFDHETGFGSSSRVTDFDLTD